ncbi:hypothetical protein DESA109040_14930 [Deinococcus saxicola]
MPPWPNGAVAGIRNKASRGSHTQSDSAHTDIMRGREDAATHRES